MAIRGVQTLGLVKIQVNLKHLDTIPNIYEFTPPCKPAPNCSTSAMQIDPAPFPSS